MALRKPFVLDTTEGFHVQLPVADTLDVGSLEINAGGSGGIVMNNAKVTGLGDATADGDALAFGQAGANLAGLDIDTNPITMNSQKITGLADGASASQDAATVAQVEALVATGSQFKEPVHNNGQLIDGGVGVGGIQAIGIWQAANQPAVGDQVIIQNGAQTRTFTFVLNIGAESAATDVSIETDRFTAMQRFVTRLNADAGTTEWAAQYHNTTGPYTQHVYLYETKVPTDTLSDSRIYGVWTTQADFKVVDFNDNGTVVSYTEGPIVTASTTDPGGTDATFGFGRAYASLIDGEIHFSADNNALYAWEQGAEQWNQISGAGAVPDATSGSGGGTKGIVTADEDLGLEIMSGGKLEVKLGTNGGLEFDGSGDVAIDLDTNPGLQLGAGGLSALPDTLRGLDKDVVGLFIDLAADPGLQFTGGDLEAKVDGTTGAMQKAAAGLQVKVSPNTGLSITAAGLAGVPDTAAGLSVGALGFAIDLAADPGLQFTGGDLEAKVNGTTGAMDKDSNGLKVKVDPSAGMEITANGVAIDLATSEPGLQFDGSGDLEVLTDGTRGQGKDASGLYNKLLSGGGLVFDGGGNMQLELDNTPDTLDVDGDGLKVVGVPLSFKLNDVAVDAAFTAAAIGILVGGPASNADSLHTHAALASTEAPKVAGTYTTAVDTVALGDPVYWNGADTLGKSDASTLAKARVIGIVESDAGAPGATPKIVSVGPCEGILAGGGSANTPYFLAPGGGLSTTLPPAGGRMIGIGWAMNANDLWVELRDFGLR